MNGKGKAEYAIGVDLVAVKQFERLLNEPGSTFRRVFTDHEWGYAHSRPYPTASLAGRWAVKEAAIKAWSSLFFGQEPPIDEAELVWSEIETRNDRFGRPALSFTGQVSEALAGDLRTVNAHWQVSLSHEGDYAIANVLLIYRSFT